MINIKKILSLVLVAGMTVTLAACGNGNTTTSSSPAASGGGDNGKG